MFKKMLIFTPFVYCAVWGFSFVLFILGECLPHMGEMLCKEGEWSLMEGPLVIWGALLIFGPGLVSFGLIKLGSAAIGKLGESKNP